VQPFARPRRADVVQTFCMVESSARLPQQLISPRCGQPGPGLGCSPIAAATRSARIRWRWRLAHEVGHRSGEQMADMESTLFQEDWDRRTTTRGRWSAYPCAENWGQLAALQELHRSSGDDATRTMYQVGLFPPRQAWTNVPITKLLKRHGPALHVGRPPWHSGAAAPQGH